jgi:hypothetical protein
LLGILIYFTFECTLGSSLSREAQMKIQPTRVSFAFLLPVFTVLFLTGCGSGSDSASGEKSVCATFSAVISDAEELESGQMEMNRILGGSEDQISPSPFELSGLGINLALDDEGISYEPGLFARGTVEKFLDVAGQCLSDDTYQYLLNYVN